METKICKRCNENKDLNKFNVDKKQNKRVNICRKCYQLKSFPQKDRFTWKNATYEQKIERLKKYFERHVIKQEGCWSWNGKIPGGGYPMMIYDYVQTNAHRISYLIHKGEIPEKIWVLHSCDNKICTNPNHLFLGTPKDNTLDKIKKGRDNSKRKLTIEQVTRIKELLQLGVNMARIARDFNISYGAIRSIKISNTWKWI